jgi:ribosome-binding protein aMBF1 (putative translation factor)
MGMRFVEAIEEGRIVKVPEDYAKREGLPVLRVEEVSIQERIKNVSKEKYDEKIYGVDEFRKPLGWKENRIVKDLVENFQWEISSARRKKNLSRKQLADMIKESESLVKLLENGILPSDDFVVVNKVQDALGINLRKDKQDFSQPLRKLVDSQEKGEKSMVFGREVEIFEEEF